MPFDIKEHENDEQFKAYLQTQIETATGGLVAKRDELLDSVTKLKKQVQNSPTPEKIAEMDEAVKKLASIEQETLEKQGNYEKLMNNAREQHQAELEGRDNKIKTLKTSLENKLVNGDLAVELAKQKVNPVLASAAIKILAGEVSVVEIDGEYVAKVGDQSIAEYVEKWATTDEGKNFILASPNGGGGPEGNGGGEGSIDEEKYFDPESPEFNKTEQMKVYRKDQKVYNQLVAKFKK